MRDEPYAATTSWQDGWYRFARHLHSPNFGPRPAHPCIDLVVLHSISLPPGIYGNDCVQDLFTNRLDWNQHPYFQQIKGLQVSAHFYIRRDGELWQFGTQGHRTTGGGTTAMMIPSELNLKEWRVNASRRRNTRRSLLYYLHCGSATL